MPDERQAGTMPLGSKLRVQECGCEFTAAGHCDVEYPNHAIFRHTKECNTQMCNWRRTPDMWFFDDWPVNRPGNIILEPVSEYILFTSHRSRDNALRAIERAGLPRPQAYYSWKRDTGQGVYLLDIDGLTVIKDLKGWRRIRGPFDDLMKCWE